MPYKCDECDFASVYKDKYNTHVKIHMRAKGPYLYDVCTGFPKKQIKGTKSADF